MKTHANGQPGNLGFFGQGTTPIGPIWVVWTDKGLCGLRLIHGLDYRAMIREMTHLLPHLNFREDNRAARPLVRQINEVLSGNLRATQVRLDLVGTPFHRRVWKEMLRVPWGQTCSYSELARRVGRPRAVRAVASACARNPIALVVPCHRILRADGNLGGYYYGLDCKRKLLRLEKASV